MQDAFEYGGDEKVDIALVADQAWCCLPTEEAFDGIVRCGQESMQHWQQIQQYLLPMACSSGQPLNHQQVGMLVGMCVQPIWQPTSGRA